ncbi:myomesin-1-like isoform X2 [Montipora foliosa]
MIDYQNSTPVIESWEGHKVTLKCAVQTTLPDLMARFFWEQNGNPLLFGKKVNWKTSSQMTVVTVKDVEFNPVTCTAKTKSTTQRLEIKIKRLYKPSEPVNMTVQEKESNDTSCKIYNKLSWDPPVDSGDTPMTSYQVEYKHPVLKKIMHRTTTQNTEHAICKVQISGHPRELNVNVRGVNKVGRGLRSENIKVLFYSTPSAPLNLTSSLFLKEGPPFNTWLHWNPPNKNGGKPLQQYLLEYKLPHDRWEFAKPVKTNDTHILFIQPEDETYIYEIRISASNVFGFGTVSEVMTVYFADIMIDYQNSTPVIESWEGHKVTLKCAVQTTLPDLMARFFWEQNGNPLLFGKKVNWKTSSQMTVVTVKDVEFNPVTCTAKTKSTTQRLEIKIKRLYKPSEPVNMTVQEKESNDTSCKIYNKLSWDPPVDSGDTPMTSYQVEYKHPVLKKIMHRTTTQNTEHAICKVQISGHPRELNVNVRGVNKVGRGFRSETIKVSFYSTPSAPLNLTSSLFLKEGPPFNTWLHWNPPNKNGGKPLQQYLLEYKLPHDPWEFAKPVKTNDTHILFIQPEDETYIYEIRISASNVFGFGTVSEVMTVYFAETPAPPNNLVRGEVFYDEFKTPYLKVTWEAPNYDGGAPVRHYIVEHKTVKTEWGTANISVINKTEFSFPAHKSEIYTVRVRAVNSLGEGKPSDFITVKLTEEDVKTLRSSNASSSLSASGFFEAFLLLLTVCFSLA